MLKAAEWISGAKEYYLQQFKDSGDVIAIDGLSAFNEKEMHALAEAVARLDPGQFTKPIETDEGIVIVKFIEKTEDDLYRCARILFELAIEPVPVPEKDLEAHVAARKRASWQRSMQDEVAESYPAKFPLGTNFVYKIWKEPRPLRRGFNPMQLQ